MVFFGPRASAGLAAALSRLGAGLALSFCQAGLGLPREAVLTARGDFLLRSFCAFACSASKR